MLSQLSYAPIGRCGLSQTVLAYYTRKKEVCQALFRKFFEKVEKTDQGRGNHASALRKNPALKGEKKKG